MRSILCNSCEVLTAGEQKIQIRYFLIVNEIRFENGLEFEIFGLKVETLDEHQSILNEACIPNITTSALEIERLIMVLLSYTVTPVSIYEVLDEYLAEPEHFLSLCTGIQGD